MLETVTCFHCQQTDKMENMYERYCHPSYREPFAESKNWHCENCLEEIVKCDFCHSEFHSSQLTTGRDYSACPECMENLTRCSNCDELVQEDETELFQNEPVCNNCAYDIRKNLTYIHEYKFNPVEFNFHERHNENNTKVFYGIELEIDKTKEEYNNCYDSEESIATEIHDQINGSDLCDYEKYGYLKYDGSIKHGMEIVTHPCSFNFHIKNMGWQYILDECDSKGYSSHDLGTCGMHIHISKVAFGSTKHEQEFNIAKLLLFFETNWNNIKKFSRRKNDQIVEYCNRYNNLLPEDQPSEICKKAKSEGRYFAVNLKPEDTVEIRIFRGTLKIETFIASLQFTHLLVELLPGISLTETLNLTWDNLIDIATEKGYNEFIEYSKTRKIIAE